MLLACFVLRLRPPSPRPSLVTSRTTPLGHVLLEGGRDKDGIVYAVGNVVEEKSTYELARCILR